MRCAGTRRSSPRVRMPRKGKPSAAEPRGREARGGGESCLDYSGRRRRGPSPPPHSGSMNASTSHARGDALAAIVALAPSGCDVPDDSDLPGDPSVSSPPNIGYILADDLGYGELGSYGQSLIRTPNLDRLAAEGMRFTQHSWGSPVCAPSRATLMSGKHTGHTLIKDDYEPGGDRRRRPRADAAPAGFIHDSAACSRTSATPRRRSASGGSADRVPPGPRTNRASTSSTAISIRNRPTTTTPRIAGGIRCGTPWPTPISLRTRASTVTTRTTRRSTSGIRVETMRMDLKVLHVPGA